MAGVKDGSGSIGFKLDPADPITDDFDEGSAVTLLLYIDDPFLYVPAVIDSIELAVDISSDVLGGTAMSRPAAREPSLIIPGKEWKHARLATIAAAPVPLRFADRTLLMTPLTLGDYGEIEQALLADRTARAAG